jgi:hypothetical protein
MAQYGASLQTAQVTTGNVRTTIDTYVATGTITPYQPNGARNPVGMKYYDNTPSTTYPNGLPAAYRYVRYSSTANAAVIAYPGPVFWTDIGKTTVTSTMSEGLTATQQSLAGWLMPNSTDISGLTAAILNGNWVWICVAGVVLNAASAASIAKGDFLIGSSGAWVPVRVASGTAPTYLLGALALADVAGSYYNTIDVKVESL